MNDNHPELNVSGDFDEDGNSDLAFIYGSVPSSSIGIDRVEHALAGEFSGEGGSDLVLFFDDPETGGQEILILQSESAGFNLPTKLYVSSPTLIVFNELSTLVPGNFVY